MEQSLQDEKYRTKEKIVEGILDLCSKHIEHHAGGLAHGTRGRIESNYYISTRDASYNKEELSFMTYAIRSLISSSKSISLGEIDFILCLKNGNYALACNILANDKDVVCICKQDIKSTIQTDDPNVSAELQNILFENLGELIRRAKSSRDLLKGIVVDCSVSTGARIEETINIFNKLIENNRLRIEKIKHAFVLCAHQNNLNYGEFALHRFFDMNEIARQQIYQVRKGEKECKDVYKYLKKTKLLHG